MGSSSEVSWTALAAFEAHADACDECSRRADGLRDSLCDIGWRMFGRYFRAEMMSDA